MIIISADKLTIIDVESGASIVARDRCARYNIVANYPSCGTRTIIENIDREIAEAIIDQIYMGLVHGSPWIKINRPQMKEPTADSDAEQNGGEWELDDEGRTICPSCGETFHPWMSGFSFCPKCGICNRKEAAP